MRFVLDSCVIAKLLVDEDLTDETRLLMEVGAERFFSFIASELALYEVQNVICRRLKENPETVAKAVEEFHGFQVEYIPSSKDHMKTSAELSIVRGISFYDAIHITLAKKYRTHLITEDHQLRKKCEEAATIREILNILQE
jgi:predicted nucleic acid-binding protein